MFAGGCHLSVTRPLPGVTVKFLGAPGVVAGLAFLVGDCVPLPLLFTARTLNLYCVPLAKFLNVWLALPDALTQVAPLSRETI